MNVVVVAAHPDDDVIGCAGAMLQHHAAGDYVRVLYLTSGQKGIPGISEDETGDIRRKEAYAAQEVLASNLIPVWFGAGMDGELTDEVQPWLAGWLAEGDIDLIYVPYEADNHPDHRAAAAMVRRAIAESPVTPPRVLMYEIWTPLPHVDHLVELSPQRMALKLDAIRAHVSQNGPNHFDEAAEGLATYRGRLYQHSTYAEAFQRMRVREGAALRITVMLLTWAPSLEHPRHDYAMRTLESAISNLRVGPRHQLQWHIADDGSDVRHVQALTDLLIRKGYSYTFSNAERGGYGHSYNLACQAIHERSDLVLPLEDDWELTRPLDIGSLADALEESEMSHDADPMRCIRLGYLGFTGQLRGRVVTHAHQTFLQFDPDSTEPHVLTGHPRLESVTFERQVGAWPEGLAAGATEWQVSHMTAARIGVAWPLDAGAPANPDFGPLFAHIGSESVGQIPPSDAMTPGPTEYAFSIGTAEDVPNRDHAQPTYYWRGVFAAIRALEPGQVLLLQTDERWAQLAAADGRRHMVTMRGKVSSRIRREGIRTTITTDFDQGRLCIELLHGEAIEEAPVTHMDDAPLGPFSVNEEHNGPPIDHSLAATFCRLGQRAAPRVFDSIPQVEITAASPVTCTCPDWWRSAGVYLNSDKGATRPGAHHHEACPLWRREADPQHVVCTCDAYHRNLTEHFIADIANEGHEQSCPFYRAGAHYWPIPATMNGESYEVTCPWCGESRTFEPYANSASGMAPRPQTVSKKIVKRLCPTCGEAYNSRKHRTDCLGKTLEPAGATA